MVTTDDMRMALMAVTADTDLATRLFKHTDINLRAWPLPNRTTSAVTSAEPHPSGSVHACRYEARLSSNGDRLHELAQHEQIEVASAAAANPACRDDTIELLVTRALAQPAITRSLLCHQAYDRLQMLLTTLPETSDMAPYVGVTWVHRFDVSQLACLARAAASTEHWSWLALSVMSSAAGSANVDLVELITVAGLQSNAEVRNLLAGSRLISVHVARALVAFDLCDDVVEAGQPPAVDLTAGRVLLGARPPSLPVLAAALRDPSLELTNDDVVHLINTLVNATAGPMFGGDDPSAWAVLRALLYGRRDGHRPGTPYRPFVPLLSWQTGAIADVLVALDAAARGEVFSSVRLTPPAPHPASRGAQRKSRIAIAQAMSVLDLVSPVHLEVAFSTTGIAAALAWMGDPTDGRWVSARRDLRDLRLAARLLEGTGDSQGMKALLGARVTDAALVDELVDGCVGVIDMLEHRAEGRVELMAYVVARAEDLVTDPDERFEVLELLCSMLPGWPGSIGRAVGTAMALVGVASAVHDPSSTPASRA